MIDNTTPTATATPEPPKDYVAITVAMHVPGTLQKCEKTIRIGLEELIQAPASTTNYAIAKLVAEASHVVDTIAKPQGAVITPNRDIITP